ncbi:MAG: thiol reductant ABC exporter subunit CydC [Isoptericola variabilis]|nr:thiol reductant ABC exporter subunit CydC [Isoptericola variabilis]
MKLFLTRSESAALRRCISMLEVSRSGFALSLLLGVTALSAAIALGGTAAWLIARASQQPPVLYLTVAATSVRLFGVSRALARYLSRLASHKVALTGMDNLRNNLYDELAGAPGTKLSSLRRGDLMTRAGADVDEVGNVVVKTLLPALVAAIVGVGTVGVITIISPAAGIILAISLIVSGVIAPALIARSVRLAESQGADARTDIAATSLAILEGATELSMAGTLERARHSLSESEAALSAALARSARLSAFARGLDVCAMGAAVIGALLIGIPQTTSGTLAQVLLAVIVLIPLSSFEGVAELAPAASQLVRSAQAAQRICALLDDEVPTKPHTIPEGPTVIEARDLAIGWPGGPTLATGISLTLRPGSSLAVVGASGIGKTTLLATLTGVIPPKSGAALINGVPAWGADRDQLTAHITMTAEDAHVFATTIYENLRVARASLTRDEASDLLTRAGLDEWIESLPEGIDTVIGSGGTTVSGGERRRLLMARALAAPAPVLAIDEASEHLDAATADRLMETLLTPSADRATLVVTHRLSALDQADHVLVLAADEPGGCAHVAAQGTHEDVTRTLPAYQWALEQEEQ